MIYDLRIKKLLIVLIILGLVLPNFSLIRAQLTQPETMEETKELGEKALKVGERELPGIIKEIWKEEVLPVWQKMWGWFRVNIWPKIESWLKPEIEKRKPIIEEEFQKEKKEVKEDLPKVGKSLWEKFKELIK